MVGGLRMTTWEEIRQFHGMSEDARFTGWMEIYSSPSDEAREILQKILSSEDTKLKYLFIRFLIHRHERRAVHYLQELMLDANPQIVKAAIHAFEKNQCPAKIQELIPVLKAPLPLAQGYAIDTLSQSRCSESLPHLHRMIVEAGEKTTETPEPNEVLPKLLSSLRLFMDKKSLPILIPFLKNECEEIRLKAVQSLGAFYASGILSLRKRLLRMISDDSPRVRQAILYALSRRPMRRDLSLTLRLLKSDPDPSLRREALIHLSHFPTPPVIRHILQILTESHDPAQILKCESLLLRMPEKRLIPGLRKIIRKERGEIRNRALIILAGLSGLQKDSQECFHLLVQSLKTETIQEKVPILEAFGRLQNQRAIPILEEYLHSPFLTSYTAMTSLIQIWNRLETVPFLKYLSDPDLEPLLKQSVLKNLIRRGGHYPYDKGLLDCLMGFFRGDRLNLRILSAQALVHSREPEFLQRLLEGILEENNPVFTPLIGQYFHHFFQADLGRFIASCMNLPKKRPLLNPLFSIMQNVSVSDEEAQSLLSVFFGLYDPLPDPSCSSLIMERIISWLLAGKITVPRLIQELNATTARGFWLNLLAKHLEIHSGRRIEFPFAPLKAWLQDQDKTVRRSAVRLMGSGGGRPSLPVLVSMICNPQAETLHKEAAQALGKLIH